MPQTTPRHTVRVPVNNPHINAPAPQKKNTSTLLIILITLMVVIIVLLCYFLLATSGKKSSDTPTEMVKHDTVVVKQVVETKTEVAAPTAEPETSTQSATTAPSLPSSLSGNFYNSEGSWPVKITLHRSGGRVTSATYRNVKYKVTLNMKVDTDASESYFNMRCPSQDFTINLTRSGGNSYSGSANSSGKVLNASFSAN